MRDRERRLALTIAVPPLFLAVSAASVIIVIVPQRMERPPWGILRRLADVSAERPSWGTASLLAHEPLPPKGRLASAGLGVASGGLGRASPLRLLSPVVTVLPEIGDDGARLISRPSRREKAFQTGATPLRWLGEFEQRRPIKSCPNHGYEGFKGARPSLARRAAG